MMPPIANPRTGRLMMLSDGLAVLRSAPHLTLFPGLAIGLTMLALFLLGDGLRDAVDPGGA